MEAVCSRGHELNDENVSWQLDGCRVPRRVCRKCNSDRAKLWRKTNAHRLERKSPGYPGQTLKRS